MYYNILWIRVERRPDVLQKLTVQHTAENDEIAEVVRG
jgi:hypothetical protein